MFKKTLNRALLELRVETRTPLLIRAGDPGLEPSPDLACVRTRHARLGSTVYIPGSSLKGVMRAAAEAAVRGESWAGVEGACDLFGDAGCGRRVPAQLGKDPKSWEVHREHCLACRTFGSTAMKGRASIRDAYPIEPGAEGGGEAFERANLTEGRHGVAINRVSGAAQRGALYDLEVVPPGSVFFGDIALENYQAWQLGLVVTALDELNDGFAQLGSTKSRGLGVVAVEVTRFLHEQSTRGGDQPKGVGAIVEPGVGDGYGLLADRALGGARGRPHGLARRFDARESTAIEEVFEAAREALGGLSA
jgi:CRISPR-associated RAMP protein (TIGR02581 family)